MQEILAASYFNFNHYDTVAIIQLCIQILQLHGYQQWVSYLIQCAWNNGAAQLPYMHTCTGGYDNYRQLAIASQYAHVLMLLGDHIHTIIKLCTILGSYSYKPIRIVAECGLLNQCACDNQYSIITIISGAQLGIQKGISDGRMSTKQKSGAQPLCRS